MAHSIYILDKNGNPANSVAQDIGGGHLVSQPISGSVGGWKGLSYTPSGAAIDTVPQNSITIPLSDWRNVAVGQGTQLQVVDDDIGAEVTRGPVLDIEESVDEHNVHWATATFADVLYDLSRADVTSSFAADIGYVNKGGSDPVPSRTPETLTGIIVRLLSLADTVWTGVNDVTGFDGVAFAVTGSINQALDKLRQARFAHFRREFVSFDPRHLHFSNFGTPLMANGLPVWIGAPGSNPTEAAANPNWLQMFTPKFSRRIEVVNSLTPTGAGNGTAQLTLRILYGNASFQGYDPAHPILRRATQSGATSDGFDYYIEDAASIAVYGRTRQSLPVPDVGVTVSPAGTTTPVDETAAAVALYAVALNRLKQLSMPTIEISFTTPAVGDIRNCGGQTVHVKYDGFAFNEQQQVLQFLALDADYWVLGVVRAVDDTSGAAMDTWTVSSSGQALASTGGTLLGVMDTVIALHAAVQFYPMAKPIPKSQNIGPGADMVLTINADNSMVRRHWALVSLRLEGMVHTRADDGHTQDVVTADMNHDVNALPHDVNALPHDVAALSSWHFQTGGVDHGSGGVNYNPTPSFEITTDPPGGAVPVMWDGSFFYATRHGKFTLPSDTLQIYQSNPTTGGTGGTVAKTTGGAGGTVAKTTGGAGGIVPKKTHAVSGGFGAVKAFATTESVYRGPSPTGVTLWVDGVQRFGPFDSTPGILDITSFVSDQNAHEVRVKSPTDGAADAFIDIRDDVTTFATKPTG